MSPLRPLALLAGFALLGVSAAPAAAETLFESPLCQVFGCSVVTNGKVWELYVFDPSVDGRARLWAASVGAPPVVTVRPDGEESTVEPGAGRGSGLGIDLDGDGEADLASPGDGYLDAGDRLGAFPLTATAAVSLAEHELRHRFYVASNVPFTVRATSDLAAREGPLGDSLGLGTIGLRVEARPQGSVAGFAFGGAGTTAGLEVEPTVRHLGDLAAGPRDLLRFTRPTATRAAEVSQQLVEITLIYDLGGYDMAQGTGELRARVEYTLGGQ
jgi:hypothetical protein